MIKNKSAALWLFCWFSWTCTLSVICTKHYFFAEIFLSRFTNFWELLKTKVDDTAIGPLNNDNELQDTKAHHKCDCMINPHALHFRKHWPRPYGYAGTRYVCSMVGKKEESEILTTITSLLKKDQMKGNLIIDKQNHLPLSHL